MITISGLTKRYRPADPPALCDVSLTIRQGEAVALLGPSGAGKSTLIRCINGLVSPDAGQVLVGGTDVAGLSPAALQELRRGLAMIFQEFHLIERLPVLTNIMAGRFAGYPFWRNALGLWSEADLAAARSMLRRVGLAGTDGVLARDLSGGQRQRVAIARAMLQRPRAVLGDEPVSNLDPVTARGIMQLLSELAAEHGITLVLSLHDVAIAREYCTRAVGIAGGRVVFDGPMTDIDADVLSSIYGSSEDSRSA